jgi:hypothetical protein
MFFILDYHSLPDLMNNSERRLLEFIARLTYNIEGLTLSAKLYVSQVLTFHFSNTLPEDFIRDVENKIAAKQFRNIEEMRSASAEFSHEQRAWLIAVLQVVREEAIQAGNRKLKINVDRSIDELTELFGLSGDTKSIEQKRKEIEEEIDQFQNRKVIKIPVALWPFALDFLIRCVLLVYWTATGRSPSQLLAINQAAIPGIIFLIGYFASRRDRKHNAKLLEAYGGAHQFKIETYLTVSQYTLLAFFLAVSVFVSYLLPQQIHAIAFFGLTFYYFIFLRFFHVGRLDENDLMRQLEHNVGGKEEFSIDQNDEEIVRLETRLNSFTSRLDAYVLESALFGALTFSGFLQIMASDLVSFADLENFATMVFDTSRAFIDLDGEAFRDGLTSLNNKISLLCLVSVESLICSGFFLAVIASRLRFSDVADRVRTSIDMAKVYNAKEEALLAEHELTERQPGRLQALTSKVSEQLHIALVALEKVNPVMVYMRYFRNAGILVFLMILISSSLFITGVLGWTFIAVVGATYVYFNYSRLNLGIRAALLSTRITFIRRAALFLLLAVSPIVLSVLVSTFSSDGGIVLLAVGYLTTGLYIFTWLLLAAHADQTFGEIEDSKGVRRTGRWLLVKNALAFTLLVWAAGNAFKQMHLTGADEMILLSLTVLAFLMYFVGYYLTKVRLLGFFAGFVLATVAIGVLFKTLHLAGGEEMLTIGIVTMIILTPVLIWKRKLFHALFLRFAAITIVLTAFYASGLFFKIQLAASHRTMSAAPIEEVIGSNNAYDFWMEPETIAPAIEKSEWYIETYGTSPGYLPVYLGLLRNYENYFELQPLDSLRDTTKLTNALTVVRQANKIRSMFNFQGRRFSVEDACLESEILLALGRKEEAIVSLEGMLQIAAADNEFKRQIASRLDSISR